MDYNFVFNFNNLLHFALKYDECHYILKKQSSKKEFTTIKKQHDSSSKIHRITINHPVELFILTMTPIIFVKNNHGTKIFQIFGENEQSATALVHKKGSGLGKSIQISIGTDRLALLCYH